MTDLKTLKQLARLMVEHSLTELELDSEGVRVKLKRGGESTGTVVHMAHAGPAPAAPATPVAAPTSAAPAVDEGLVAITSPMVGTFYAASSPDAKPFMAPGDRVGPESVVCIIEAMKVFNEIKAELSGTVEKVMVSSGQAVEFGQPLFLVRVQ